MIIQKGAQVWYWNGTASVPATISKVASTGAGNAFAAVRGTKLDLLVSGKSLRSVPVVVGTPTPEQLSAGFASTRQYTPPPKPITFDEALVQLKAGKTISRPGVRVTPLDAAAADWLPS